MTPENVFCGIPSDLPDELFTTIHSAGSLRIERIVSQAHASPPGFWYDQDQHEWLLVLQGMRQSSSRASLSRCNFSRGRM